MKRTFYFIICLSVGILGCERSKPSAKQSVSSANTAAVPTDVGAVPQEAVKTSSGLASKLLKAGTGNQRPTAKSRVTVHYTGWTTDGKQFDSSLSRGQPSTFGLNQVIPGWTEGLQLMVPGEKRRLWIPEGLAYKGQSGMPKGMLVFDVELLSIEGGAVSLPSAPVVTKAEASTDQTATGSAESEATQDVDKAPADVAAPPQDSIQTASGLASKVVSPGTGTEKPKADSVITINFKGWTTAGRLFNSSRGEPAKMPMNSLMDGLVEGLQLMVAGEKRRFWVPQALAYKGKPGRPLGMLVFDVHLLTIQAPKEVPKAPPTVAAPPPDAVQEETGLFTKVLRAGSGAVNPTDMSAVMVKYTAWTADGKLIDTTETVGDPAVFPVVRAIPGFSEGLKMMKAGEKRRLWIPESLAYRGMPDRPKGMLVYDVELLDIKEIPQTLPKNIAPRDMVSIPENEHGDLNPAQPPTGFTECHDVHCHHENGRVYSYGEVMRAMKARDIVGGMQNNPAVPPEDVAAPTLRTESTESGLKHRLLFTHKKSSEVMPKIDSLVTFHFSGWTQSGTSFLSSILAGRPVKLPLVTLPSPGLIEALQTMKVGEKRRFWMPESLTGRDKGMEVPAGDLVYDIELIDTETL